MFTNFIQPESCVDTICRSRQHDISYQQITLNWLSFELEFQRRLAHFKGFLIDNCESRIR